MENFDAMFAELHRAAYRVAFQLLGDRTEAEDVASEALARTYVRWRTVEQYAAAWASRVAANLAIDRIRRAKHLSKHEVPDHPGSGDAFAADRLDLQNALRALPRRQRDVVTLRYVADQSEDSVAAALGISVGSVKTHASRGLAALRARLGDRVGS